MDDSQLSEMVSIGHAAGNQETPPYSQLTPEGFSSLVP